MTHRDIFLCDEIDKVKNYTQEELFKMNENQKERFDTKANISWIKRVLLQQNKETTPDKDALFSKKPVTEYCASCDNEIKNSKMGQSH